MARTHRKHLAPGKRAKRGPIRNLRSQVGVEAVLASGAGAHGKSYKAERRATHVALRRGDFA